MPTSQEYRERAQECLSLTKVPNEWYVNTALMKMAIEFRKRAERLEYGERHEIGLPCDDAERSSARGKGLIER